MVDRRGRTLSEMEEMWSTLILPMSESHFMREPMSFLREGDYSHFNRRDETSLASDAEMARHVRVGGRNLRESLREGKATG